MERAYAIKNAAKTAYWEDRKTDLLVFYELLQSELEEAAEIDRVAIKYMLSDVEYYVAASKIPI